jgi:hypothetical protein
MADRTDGVEVGSQELPEPFLFSFAAGEQHGLTLANTPADSCPGGTVLDVPYSTVQYCTGAEYCTVLICVLKWRFSALSPLCLHHGLLVALLNGSFRTLLTVLPGK